MPLACWTTRFAFSRRSSPSILKTNDEWHIWEAAKWTATAVRKSGGDEAELHFLREWERWRDPVTTDASLYSGWVSLLEYTANRLQDCGKTQEAADLLGQLSRLDEGAGNTTRFSPKNKDVNLTSLKKDLVKSRLASPIHGRNQRYLLAEAVRGNATS